MKDIKNKWEQELEQALPSLREDVLQAPIPVAEKKQKTGSLFSAFGKKTGWIAGGLAAVIALCLLLPGLNIPTPTPTTPPVTGTPAAVMVEINPGVIFTVDEQERVTQVTAANADGDVVLSDEGRRDALVGISVSDSTEKFVEYAVELGYLQLNDPTVIRVSTCQESAQSELTDHIRTGLESYFRSNGAYVAVSAENVSPEEFACRTGFDGAQSVEQLLEQIREGSAFYFERQDRWEESYVEAVDLKERLRQQLDKLPLIDETRKQELLEDIVNNLEFIFSLLGLEGEELEQYIAPTTKDDYIQRLQDYCREKAEEYENRKDEPREPLTEQEYADFIQKMIDRYGSLESYWENKK